MSGRPMVRSFSTARLFAAGLSLSLFGGLWFAWSADPEFISDPESQTLRPVPAELRPTGPVLSGAPPDSLSPSDLQKLDRVAVPARPKRAPAEDGDQDQARALIDRMLPNATPDEREIWVEQLQGMPLGVAEDLLRFRQQMRPETKAKSSLWSPESRINPPAKSPGIIIGEEEPFLGGLTESVGGEPQVDEKTVQTLRGIFRQNLLHRHTPGYVRVEPVLGPMQLRGSRETTKLGLACLGQRLDLMPRHLLVTGRSMDVAILPDQDQKTGIVPFFAIETTTGTAYTRCGRLEMDAERRLAVRGAGGLCPLTPAIVIPEDCGSLQIDVRGQVHRQKLSSKEHADPQQDGNRRLGQIRLVTFLDANQLTYDESGWLRESVRTGPATGVEPELCLLRAGHLEASNVRVDVEQAQLQWIEELARGLPNEVRETANGLR